MVAVVHMIIDDIPKRWRDGISINQRASYRWVENDDGSMERTYISWICDKIRRGDGNEADWEYLHKHTDPRLRQAMIKDVCQRVAGIKAWG